MINYGNLLKFEVKFWPKYLKFQLYLQGLGGVNEIRIVVVVSRTNQYQRIKLLANPIVFQHNKSLNIIDLNSQSKTVYRKNLRRRAWKFKIIHEIFAKTYESSQGLYSQKYFREFSRFLSIIANFRVKF